MSTVETLGMLSVLIALYAAVITRMFYVAQNNLNETQKQLNNLLLKKERLELSENSKAEVAVNLLRVGSQKYRIKVYNKGKAAARNVSLSFEDDCDIILPDDYDSKFPMEVIEPKSSVELIASVTMMSKSKYEVTAFWEDSTSGVNSKKSIITI